MSNSTGEGRAKLRELIKDIDFGMLTTVNVDGSLHSRPMSCNGDIESAGDLCFTYAGSHKADEIRKDRRVNVSFADPKRHR
jgi:general stress protein 26